MRFASFRHLLSYQAETIPDHPALLYGGGPDCCTYRELYDRVLTRAEQWRSSGKTCLGLLCDGSLACVTDLFAANLAGLQVVLLDENVPEERLPRLLTYTDVDVLRGDEDLEAEMVPHLTGGVRDGGGRILFFTSGTTEAARAVVLTDRSLCASAFNGGEMLPLSPEDTLLCMLPLNHVFGFVCGLLWGLSAGAAVALGRGMRHYMDDFTHFRPTAVSLVPTLLSFLLGKQVLNPELRLILIGAGGCPPALLRRAAGLGLQISFGYGLTETSSGVAISVRGNPYAMEICPDDVVTLAEDGEILIQAPTCMMEGYYKKPAETAAVLQNGVLHTGDLGRMDEGGKLHITGRKKEILVLADGTKLYLPEYEADLAQALGTNELALVLRNGRPVLVLTGPERDKGEIIRHLSHVIAERPRGQQIKDILFLAEPLPRTVTGKLRRWELEQKLEENK